MTLLFTQFNVSTLSSHLQDTFVISISYQQLASGRPSPEFPKASFLKQEPTLVPRVGNLYGRRRYLKGKWFYQSSGNLIGPRTLRVKPLAVFYAESVVSFFFSVLTNSLHTFLIQDDDVNQNQLKRRLRNLALSPLKLCQVRFSRKISLIFAENFFIRTWIHLQSVWLPRNPREKILKIGILLYSAILGL